MSTAAIPSPLPASSAAERVKDFILANSLRPGDPLPGEVELAGQLGISRPSLREALRQLQALDIVSVRKGSGTFVGQLSLSPLVEALAFRSLMVRDENFETFREVIKVRRYLDLGIGEKICGSLRGTRQPGLEMMVAQMVEKAEQQCTFPREDFAFHDGLLALAGNEVVRQLVASLWKVHAITIPKLNLPTATDLLATARAHGAILSAAQNGDVRAYSAAVIEHYRPIEAILELR